MRVRAIINGQEIKGYWNGKTYKSKIDPEKNIRVYIDNKEYDIPKEAFKYEEVLTEKQLKFAYDLKLKFLEKLEKIKNSDSKIKPSPEDFEIIYNYFKNKEPKYFLDNKLYLDSIIVSIMSSPQLVKAVINDEIDKLFKFVEKEKDINLNEVLKPALVYMIKRDKLPFISTDFEFEILEDNNYYYVSRPSNTVYIRINKENKSVDEVHYKEIDKKSMSFVAEVNRV